MRASSPIDVRRRRALLVFGAVWLAAGGCATRPQAVPADVRAALAPTGTLRIAVYPGSPTSLVQNAPAEAMRGLTVDIGRELAR
jgi:polar amino acid transport system substrate-binding protein